MKRILLFGGTFDPIHLGHIHIANKAYDFLHANVCYFIPAKNPRWKEPLSEAKDRLMMIRLALKDEKRFRLSLIEYQSKDEINYTFDTVKKMAETTQGEYFYLIGSDQLEVLHRWYRIDELAKLVHFVVFERTGYPIHHENQMKFNCILLPEAKFDQSSSDIRFLHSLHVPKTILDYIAEKNLYYMQILRFYMSKKRLRHSVAVASLAYDIAFQNGLNPHKAYLAGLLHDIAKEIPPLEAEKLMKQYFATYLPIATFAYHQFLALLTAQDIFKVDDPEILSAIQFHATGNAKMTPLGKIIYAADKIEPTRGYDSSALISACLRDYKKGFIEVLKENVLYFRSHQIDYENPLTHQCLEYYIKENNNGTN